MITLLSCGLGFYDESASFEEVNGMSEFAFWR